MATGPTAYAGGITLPSPTANLLHGGFFDYNDLATATTPISVTGGAGFVNLTNDGLGSFTNKSYPPYNVTDVWDTVTNSFDWTQLSDGDSIEIRLDLNVTTTAPNQEIEVVLSMADGEIGSYNVPFIKSIYKNAGVQELLRYEGVYMGDDFTRLNPAKFKIQSDGNCTVKVNGWYCMITRRG